MRMESVGIALGIGALSLAFAIGFFLTKPEGQPIAVSKGYESNYSHSVKWVRFEDDKGEMHYYWLEDNKPFTIIIPNNWPQESK